MKNVVSQTQLCLTKARKMIKTVICLDGRGQNKIRVTFYFPLGRSLKKKKKTRTQTSKMGKPLLISKESEPYICISTNSLVVSHRTAATL